MNTLFVILFGAITLLTGGAALAQSGNMMNGGMWGSGWMGGFGGIWGLILLAIVVVGVVAFVVKKKGK